MTRYQFPAKPRYQQRRYIPDLSPEERIRQVLWLRAQGWYTTEIAALLHVSRQTVYEWLARHEQSTPQPERTGRPRARQYPALIAPDGTRHTIPNDTPVAVFAQYHDMDVQALRELLRGKRQTHHGWKAERE